MCVHEFMVHVCYSVVLLSSLCVSVCLHELPCIWIFMANCKVLYSSLHKTWQVADTLAKQQALNLGYFDLEQLHFCESKMLICKNTGQVNSIAEHIRYQ